MRKLDALHNYDCLRANKSMMAWGVEARVPFLDRRVPRRGDAHRRRSTRWSAGRRHAIEKAVLREAFDGYLPDAILWRQKEQFSDGVGYGWIDGLKAHAEAQVSDREFAAAASRFPHQPAADQGGLPLPRASSSSYFPGAACAADRAGRQVDRVLVAGGDRVGCGVRERRRSVGARGRGRAPGGAGV